MFTISVGLFISIFERLLLRTCFFFNIACLGLLYLWLQSLDWANWTYGKSGARVRKIGDKMTDLMLMLAGEKRGIGEFEGYWKRAVRGRVQLQEHVTCEKYYMKEEAFGATNSSLILQIWLNFKRMDRMEYSNGSKI